MKVQKPDPKKNKTLVLERDLTDTQLNNMYAIAGPESVAVAGRRLTFSEGITSLIVQRLKNWNIPFRHVKEKAR